MSRWKQTNTVAGYIVFGLPALLAVPALVSTIARFGLWTTLTSAALPVLVVTAPLLLWIRYTRRRPLWRLARLGWTGVAVLILLNIAASPIRFWTGPVLAVLLSEIVRVHLGHRDRSTTRKTVVQGQS